MAKFPRRGKKSDKTIEDGKIKNSVSASDKNPGRADDAHVPPAPKPSAPPKVGRTDLNAAQGFQRQQQMYGATTPQMSKRQQAKVNAMKAPAPQPNSPAPGMSMGSSYSPEPEAEQPEFVRLERFEIDRLAMQSVRDVYAGREAADLNHIHPDDFDAIVDAVPFAQDRFDRQKNEWQGMAFKFTLTDMTMMTAEGEKGATVTSSGTAYTKDGDWLIGVNASGKRSYHEFSGIYDAVAEKPESLKDMNANFPAGDRYAVFFHNGGNRIQFSDSLPWRNEAVQDLIDFQAALHGAGEQAIADRLYVSDLTPYERAVEQVEQREQQEGQRHERVFAELTGEQFPPFSTATVQVDSSLSAEEQNAIINAFDKAPEVGGQQAVHVHDALPQEGRAMTAEGLREQYQWHANKMHDEGRNLCDIYSATGVKPEGVEQTAWEKTEYVYGQPTSLDRLKDLGSGAFAVSPVGFTYAMSADGNSLLRFDIDGNPAGQKPVEEVQAYLREKRGVEFDEIQEAKEMHAAELAEQKLEDQQVAERKIAAGQNAESSEVAAEILADEMHKEMARVVGIDEGGNPIYDKEQQERGTDRYAEVDEQTSNLAEAEELDEQHHYDMTYEEERGFVYATNNADEISAFEDRAYENSAAEARFWEKSDHFDMLELYDGIKTYEGSLTDDLQAQHFGAKISHEGKDYHLEGSDLIQSKAGNDLRRAYAADVEQTTKDISADNMPAGLDRNTFAMSTATMGYADANDGKTMVSQLQELPEGSKLNFADFDYRLDGDEIVASQSIELNRAGVAELEKVAIKKQEAQAKQAVETPSHEAAKIEQEVPAKVESVVVEEQKVEDASKASAEVDNKAVTEISAEAIEQSESKTEIETDTKAIATTESKDGTELSVEQSPKQVPSTFDRFLQERNDKEAAQGLAPQQGTVQFVEQKPAVEKTGEPSQSPSSFDMFVAQQDKKEAEQGQQTVTQNEAVQSVDEKPAVEKAEEPSQSPSSFDTFVANQNQKEAEADEEERRRGSSFGLGV